MRKAMPKIERYILKDKLLSREVFGMKTQWSVLARFATIMGLTFFLWTVFFLAIYGAVRLAERFGIC